MTTRSRRRAWLRLVAYMVVMAVGVGVYLIGHSRDRVTAVPLGENLPINAGAVDKGDISANNSPSVAANPLNPHNVVVVNRIDLPLFSCALHRSEDGGATWGETEIPFPEGEEAPPRCFAPDLAFSPDGTLYVTFATLIGEGNSPNAIWMVSSRDGGATLSTPTRVLGPLAFQVRLAADPDHQGRLYLSWLQADNTADLAFPEPGNPIQVARSDDGGATWRPAVQVSTPERGRVVAPSIALGPRDDVYVLYLDLVDDVLDYHGAHEGRGGEPYPGRWSLVLARSSDQGMTWQESVVDDALVPTERFIVFIPPSPSLAVDRRTGQIYAGFHEASLGDADVWVWASADRGASFGPRRRVNDTATGDGTSQYLPKLAVAPNGRLDVVYYDRRDDDRNIHNSVSFQWSSDGGRSFAERLALTDVAFDSRIGFGSFREMPDLGSRLGLVSTDTRALAVWTDTRAGTEISGKQDLGRMVVAFEPPSPLGTPLRISGAALVLGVMALLWRRRRDFRGRRRHLSKTPEPSERAVPTVTEPSKGPAPVESNSEPTPGISSSGGASLAVRPRRRWKLLQSLTRPRQWRLPHRGRSPPSRWSRTEWSLVGGEPHDQLRHLWDEYVFDAFPYQILAEGHLPRGVRSASRKALLGERSSGWEAPGDTGGWGRRAPP